jgi:hypothetical protein
MILRSAEYSVRCLTERKKIPLDRKIQLLYHSKTVGIIGSMMKKLVAKTLIFLLPLTVLISGASGYSDCAVKCMREMAKAHPHATMGSKHLRVPDCCSGGMQSPCEMNKAPQVKIPECSIASHATVFANLIGIGMISSNADSDHIRTMQVALRTIAIVSYKDPPIYLRTLSILC